MMKLANAKKQEAFTIVESFLVLLTLFVLSMLLVGLYLHDSDQTGDKETGAVTSNISKIIC